MARPVVVNDGAGGSPAYAVELCGVTRRFGAAAALDGIDLRLEQGSVTALVGSNGAGKSTMIKVLCTLLPVTSGSARVFGFDVTTQGPEIRRRMGYVPQHVSADGVLTGRENLAMAARLFGVPRWEVRKRVGAMLEFAALESVADRRVAAYSGGMIRRLELAQALIHRPSFLLLDEPTIGLDPAAKHSIWNRLHDIRDELGATILLSTHDMEEAAELCDHVAILHAGRLAAWGTPSALRDGLGAGRSLHDVFLHHTANLPGHGATAHEIHRTRRTVQRLG